MFPFEQSTAAVVGLAVLAITAGAWFLHSRVRAFAMVAAALAALAAGVDLADRLVETDREALETLLPALARAAERRDAATVLAGIDPAIRPLRDETQALLDRLRPEEIRITRLEVAVDRSTTPRRATADVLVRYHGDVGDRGGPATGQVLVPLTLRLHKPAEAWLVTEARFDDDPPLGTRRPSPRAAGR